MWPGITLAALWMFRQEIRELIGRVRRGRILGQEFELDESLSNLNRSAEAANLEVAALPQSRRDGSELRIWTDKNIVQHILDEAAKSPKVALLILATEMERELRELLASIGLLRRNRYVPFRQAIETLEKEGRLPSHILNSVGLFWDVRNRLVHGQDATDNDVLRAIDSGITILKTLQAVPHETNIVYNSGVDIYADPLGKQVLANVKGVILETESPGGATKTRRIYPSTKTHFQKGKRVAWEWSDEHEFGESWYRDPDTGNIEYAWKSSLEFVGRHLGDI